MPSWHILFNPAVLTLGWALVAFFSMSERLWGMQKWYAKVEDPHKRRLLIIRTIIGGTIIDPVGFWFVALTFFGLWPLTHSVAITGAIWMASAALLVSLLYIPTSRVSKEFPVIVSMQKRRWYFTIAFAITGPTLIALLGLMVSVAGGVGLGLAAWDNFYWSQTGFKMRHSWSSLIGTIKELPGEFSYEFRSSVLWPVAQIGSDVMWSARRTRYNFFRRIFNWATGAGMPLLD